MSKALTPDQKMAKIRRALARTDGRFNWLEVYSGLQVGKYQWFENDDAVCITEIVDAPKSRYLQCWLVAGKLPGAIALQEVVERFARENYCSRILATGRPGWMQLANKHGWKARDVTFEKELKNAS